MLCIVARFTRFTMKECSQGSNILSTLLEFWFVSVRQFDTCFDTSFTCTPTKRDRREDKITSKYGSSLLRCACVCHVPCAKDKVWCLPSLQYIRCTFPHITISFHRVTPSFSSFFWPSPIVRPYLYQFLPMLHVPL